MRVLAAVVAVVGLFLLGLLGGVWPLGWIFGVVIPYLALAVFLGGLAYRVWGWAQAPVPFRIPTTCGQQKSLPWIKQSKLDNPSGLPGVVARMFLEIVFFRSLLRNTKSQLLEGGRLAYATSLGLWFGALAFHWSLLIILIRHLRFFITGTEGIVPAAVSLVQKVDGFFEVGLPVFFATTFIFLGAVAYLLVRRLSEPQVRYISLVDDYFLLLLLLGIGLSGFLLRHVLKTDVVGIKELAVGLVSFAPSVPETVSGLFFGHMLLVSGLLAYFPFSKLVHMAGVFLSPTRNLANNNRMVRHVNPWDYPVEVHTYEEYEDEFRDKMKAAGLPVERE
jgi:nitrate reductase gamma subunit